MQTMKGARLADQGRPSSIALRSPPTGSAYVQIKYRLGRFRRVDAVVRSYPVMSSVLSKSRISRGLGKAAWHDIDAAAYIAGERASWEDPRSPRADSF